MKFMPPVIDGRHVMGYMIEVRFNDGKVRIVDFGPYGLNIVFSAYG